MICIFGGGGGILDFDSFGSLVDKVFGGTPPSCTAPAEYFSTFIDENEFFRDRISAVVNVSPSFDIEEVILFESER